MAPEVFQFQSWGCLFFSPFISIQTCLFGKTLSINLSVLIATFSNLVMSPSTLIFTHSFSVQSCHLFMSST